MLPNLNAQKAEDKAKTAKLNDVIQWLNKNAKDFNKSFGTVIDVIAQLAKEAKKLSKEDAKRVHDTVPMVTKIVTDLSGLLKASSKLDVPNNKRKFDALGSNIKSLMSAVIDSVSKLKLRSIVALPLKIKLIRFVFGSFQKLATIINKVSMTGPTPAAMKKVMLQMKSLQTVIDSMAGLINTVHDTKVNVAMKFKLKLFSVLVGDMIQMSKKVSQLVKNVKVKSQGKALLKIAIIGVLIGAIAKILSIVKDVKASPVIYLKIWMIGLLVGALISTVRRMRRLMQTITAAFMASVLVKLIILRFAISQLSAVIGTIAAIKMPLMIGRKLNRIGKFVLRLTKVVRRIQRLLRTIRTATLLKAVAKLKLLSMVFSSLRGIIISALILAPLAMLFIVLSPILILAFAAVMLVVKAMIFFIRFAANPKVILSMLVLILFNAVLLVIAASMLALSLIAVPLALAMPAILIFMLELLAFIVIYALISAALTVAAPFLLPGLLGIGLVALAVLGILFIAAMLWLLQFINLDVDKIRENVKHVMDTATQVILWALMPADYDMENKGEKSVASSLWSIIGAGFQKIFGALIAAVALVAIVVAVASILFIAAMLRLLQNLELDRFKIMDNVRMVFDVCESILEYINTPTWSMDREEDKDAVTALCGFTYKPLLKVLDSIMGAAGLLVMLIGVFSILLMATMLRLLQNLDLDESKIMANVDMVFGICEHIIAAVYKGDGEDKTVSERGIMAGLFDFVYKPLSTVVESIFAMAYLAVMVIAVLLVLMLAGMLRLLQIIDLDESKIMDNVNLVLSTVQHIINRVFTPDEEERGVSERGAIGALLSWIYKPITSLLDSIFAMAYLAVMVIAVLCILGIAELLKLIQGIQLNKAQIDTNVKIVLDTTKHIIDGIFGPDEEDSSESKRGGIAGFFEWLGSAMKNSIIGRIVGAVASLAYLAVMVIAILCVVALAELIKLIGAIDPKDIEKGLENTTMVINACQSIIDQIFQPDDENTQQSNRGIMRELIGWVSEDLGKLFDAVLTISYLALMFIAMVIVLGLVKMMKSIGEIDKQIMENAANNVDIVMTTLHNIVYKVYDGEDPGSEPSSRGALLDIVAWVAGDKVASIIQCILSIAYLAYAFFAIYIVAAIAKSMEQIGHIDKDIMTRAKENTQGVLDTAAFIVDKLVNSGFSLPEYKATDNMEKLMKFLLPDDLLVIARALTTINALAFSELMIGALGRISESISKVAETDTAQVGPARDKAVLVIQSAGKIIESLQGDLGEIDSDKLEDISKGIGALQNTLVTVTGINATLKKLSEAPDYDVQAAYDNTVMLFKTSMALADYIVNGEEDLEDVGVFGGWSAHFKKASKLSQLITILTETKDIMQRMSQLLQAAAVTAQQMAPLENVSFNGNAVIDNIKGVWGTINAITDAGLAYFDKDKDDLDDLPKLVKQQSEHIKAAKDLVVNTAFLFQNMKALSTWFGFLETMKYPEYADANINMLFEGLNRIPGYAARMEISGSGDSWSVASSYLLKAIETIKTTIKLVEQYSALMPRIQDVFNAISDLNFDERVITENSTKSQNALRQMFNIIQAASFESRVERVRQNMDLMDRINESIIGFTHVSGQDVRNSKNLTDNYIAFLTRVNTMDLNKLKTTEQLMKHWADMSRTINGNFEGLARALNEHIAPAINELNKTMDGVMKVQQEIIEELKKPIDTPDGDGGSSTTYWKKEGDKYITVDSTGKQVGTSTYKSSAEAESDGGATGGEYKPETGEAPMDNYDDDPNYRPTRRLETDLLHPYGPVRPSRKADAIERCMEGDFLRVKIVN